MNPRARAIRQMTERLSREAFPRKQVALAGVAMSAYAPGAQSIGQVMAHAARR